MDHEVRSSRLVWLMQWNPVSTKNTKIRQAWWWAPIIPATWEAEAWELLEPRRWRLQWAEIAPLHSSLGNKSETLSQKTKQNKTKSILTLTNPSSLRRQITPYSLKSQLISNHTILLQILTLETLILLRSHISFESRKPLIAVHRSRDWLGRHFD